MVLTFDLTNAKVMKHAKIADTLKQSIHSHPVAIGLTGVHIIRCFISGSGRYMEAEASGQADSRSREPLLTVLRSIKPV